VKYYIISGEASGDLHGSNLVKSIHQQDNLAQIRAWGGDRMEAAGSTIIKHYRDLAFMGFVEVIKHLGTILNNLSFCKNDISAFQPDVIVLIDYPGFNLRIAKWAKQQGFKVVYYISPQVWAWKEKRVQDIKKYVDELLVILPFEVSFYKQWGMDVTYTGHPLVQVIQEAKNNVQSIPAEKPIIAIIPGSRAQEINTKLPIMLSVVSHFPEYDFVIAQAPSLPIQLYKDLIGDLPVRLLQNDTYSLMQSAVAGMVTSGTATLEAALFGLPQVVCYKGNGLSFWIAKRLVKVKYISLVNLIMDKLVVKELIQNDLNKQNLISALNDLLENTSTLQHLKQQYASLWNILGSKNASEIAATAVVKWATHPTTQ
jgi:lipid-A-disaccharide synthase